MPDRKEVNFPAVAYVPARQQVSYSVNSWSDLYAQNSTQSLMKPLLQINLLKLHTMAAGYVASFEDSYLDMHPRAVSHTSPFGGEPGPS